jgi:hypothetical protein
VSGVWALIEMFVGPLKVNVRVVVQVLGVVEVMGVDWAPIVAVVGPATVNVAVTVLELDGGRRTDEEGSMTTVELV